MSKCKPLPPLEPCVKHVVSYSGGLASWACAKRVIEEHGKKDVVLLFADVNWEEPDTYRFLHETSNAFGIPITRISEGRTPVQLFMDQQYIGNSRVDLCSRVLKRVPLDKWCKENGPCIRYIGYDWTETNRFERLLKHIPNAVAPLMEPPYLSKCDMARLCRADGIEPPKMYSEGFPHNNCGGACVKAGQAQWAHVLRHQPERYAEMEAAEIEVSKRRGRPCTVLKDRRGGKTKPMMLVDFRARVEAGEYDKNEWGGCGCATDYDELPGLYE
jgi:hypothetical protein